MLTGTMRPGGRDRYDARLCRLSHALEKENVATAEKKKMLLQLKERDVATAVQQDRTGRGGRCQDAVMARGAA